MKRISKRMVKMVCAILTLTICTWSLLLPVGVSQARWRGNWYGYGGYHRHHRYHHHHGNGWAWGLGGLALGVLIGNLTAPSSSHESSKYSDKYAKYVTSFDSVEASIFKAIDELPRGTLHAIQSYDENDLGKIKKVINKLYGEYAYVGSVERDGHEWVIFYKLSRVYENAETIGMKYTDFVAYDFVCQLPVGNHAVPYNDKLAKRVVSVLKQYYPASVCYRDGDLLIINKQ